MSYHQSWEELNEEAKSMIIQRVIYISGFSKNNFPVIKINVKQINVAKQNVKDCFLQAFCYIINYSKTMKQCSQQHKFIFILESDRMNMFSFPFGTLQKVIEVTSREYPNHLDSCLILNPSTSLYIVWSIIDLFIHSSNKKQVKIVREKETFSILHDYIEQDQIETRYGGNNLDSFYPNFYKQQQQQQQQQQWEQEQDQYQQYIFEQCYFGLIPFLLFNRSNMGFKNSYSQQSNKHNRILRLIRKIVNK